MSSKIEHKHLKLQLANQSTFILKKMDKVTFKQQENYDQKRQTRRRNKSKIEDTNQVKLKVVRHMILALLEFH